MAPLCTTHSFPRPGALEQNTAQADQAEPGSYAGLDRRRVRTREEGVKETPVRGRSFQVQKGKKRPRSQGPDCEGDERRSKRGKEVKLLRDRTGEGVGAGDLQG